MSCCVIFQEQTGSTLSLKRQLSSARGDYEKYSKEHNASGNLPAQLEKATSTFSKLQKEVNDQYPEFQRTTMRLKQNEEKIKQLQKKIEQGDHEVMRHLRNINLDTYKAVQWVRKELFCGVATLC